MAKSIPKWLGLLLITSIIIGGYFLLSHPLSSNLPLGYDPGLYKSVIEAYSSLLVWDWAMLPDWIQSMYPPFVGMIGSLFGLITGLNAGRIVHTGVVSLVFLLLGGIYYYTKQLAGRTSALITISFAATSFVLYNLYRRGYIKQLLALFFFVIVLGLFIQKKRRASIPILMTGLITQRPLIVLMGISLFLGRIFQKDHTKDHRIDYLMGFGVAITAALSLYGPLTSKLIIPLITIFLTEGTPTIGNDGFQAGGTFLTILDYLYTNWVVVVVGIVGGLGLLKKKNFGVKTYKWLVIVLLLRVFGQRFFFQRMIGYLDIFLLVGVGVVGKKIIDRWKRGWIVIVGLWFIHTAQSFYRREQIKYPIIERDEFAFIQQIDSLIEENSVIIVPGVEYSPWIQGWTNAHVIAPGLFDLNKRGAVNEGWIEKRREASPIQKCNNVQQDYGGLGKTLYLWVGSKQEIANITGGCFQLIKAQKIPGNSFHALYRLDFIE